MAKATSAFDRNAEIYDTTIGWRFVNPKLKAAYGDDTMPSTGENVAQDFQVSREDQDAFALRSQEKTARAQANGRLAAEIVPVAIPQRKGDPVSSRPRRASARRHHAGSAGETQADRSRGRDGHRRQCLGSQRRRGRDLIASEDAAKRTASRRGRASSARRSPGSRRASWASVRRRVTRS